jgi:hypothetical protein|tara:strand:+ start:1529 stop:2293 length:765 start_codon:yes stop_codon:yes gene_type:complete
MSEETGNVTTKQSGALAKLDFVADSGMGLENMDKGDLALPFLKLLQSGSDETKKKHAKYVDGAEAGMFYNTVTKKLYDGEKGIEVIPVFYKMTYPEWAPFERREGRPISNDRGPEILKETTQNNSNKDVLSNGNEIIKTANHFVIINGERPEKALMTMKSTQLKVSRGWNSLMEDQFETDPKTGKSIPAPMFSRVYRLKSVENAGSNFSWHGYNITMVKKVDDVGLYQMARDFYNSLKNAQQKTATVSEDKANY